MNDEYILNHPWTIYFQEPASAYTKYSIYYIELERLLKFFINFNKTAKIDDENVQLTNIIIGTPMEMAIHKSYCEQYYEFQWQQLFPKHIFDFINHYKKMKSDIKINVNIIIISPDEIFMDSEYYEPLFVKKCKDYKFEKIQNREYIYNKENLTIKVDIFTCPFPQLEKRVGLIKKYNAFISKCMPYFEINNFNVNESDIKFISDFYEQLEMIGDNPNTNLIINSFATFRNVRDYDNYGLFPSLLEFANKYKIIATEWNFEEKNFKFRIVSHINFTVNYLDYEASYIEPVYAPLIISDYVKITKNEIKEKINKSDICILIKFPYNRMVYKRIFIINNKVT